MKQLFLLEDDMSLISGLSFAVKKQGYEIDVARTTLEADTLWENGKYDLAILDIMLPGMDGFELLEVVKKYNIPVIFLTAKDDLDSKIQGLTSGADDYIVKPFEILELIVRMEKILERSNKIGKLIKVLDLEINVDEHKVRKNGVEINLKPKEFELLVVLAKNKNIAISRENF